MWEGCRGRGRAVEDDRGRRGWPLCRARAHHEWGDQVGSHLGGTDSLFALRGRASAPSMRKNLRAHARAIHAEQAIRWDTWHMEKRRVMLQRIPSPSSTLAASRPSHVVAILMRILSLEIPKACPAHKRKRGRAGERGCVHRSRPKRRGAVACPFPRRDTPRTS